MRTLMLPAACALTIAATAQAPSTIGEFRRLVGQTKTICGRVSTYEYPGKDGSGDCSLRLYIGGPSWNPLFYVLLKPAAGFVPVPEPYLSREVCATGAVESDSKREPFVTVNAGSGLEIKDNAPAPLFGEGAARACETGMVAPKLKKAVKADYPEDEFHRRLAARNYADERVALQAVVADDGSVRECRTMYAFTASFARAAEAAVKKWQFTPGMRNGKPVAVVVEAEITFNLR